jgi:hypothetical protein
LAALLSSSTFLASAEPNMNTEQPRNPSRRFWWLIFWISFLGAPCSFLLTLTRRIPNPIRSFAPIFPVIPLDQLIWISFVTGVLVSGFALARLFAKMTLGLILGDIGCAAGDLIIYGAVFFFGCLLLINK